jgi:hypothetical protein
VVDDGPLRGEVCVLGGQAHAQATGGAGEAGAQEGEVGVGGGVEGREGPFG